MHKFQVYLDLYFCVANTMEKRYTADPYMIQFIFDVRFLKLDLQKDEENR